MGDCSEIIRINDRKITKLRSELKQAIELNKESLFSKLIEDSDVSNCCSALESFDLDSLTSPFESACRVVNRVHFIRECISIGCDANKQNSKCGRRPINFAIEHFHYANLEALLSDTNVCLDVQHSFEFPFTPLNYLTSRISDELYEFKENCRCIELLAQHGADVNIAGKDGKTPIRSILDKKNLSDMRKRIVLQCIFGYAKFVDVDSENESVRTHINVLIPDIKLSTPIGTQPEQGIIVDYVERRPKDFDGNEIEFWQYVRSSKDHLRESFWHSALDYAVRRGLAYSIERIFRSDVICTMHSLDECKEPLLVCAIRQFGWHDNDNFENCLNLFFNHRKIDINAKDKFGYTALSGSVKYANPNVTAKLLERGAYIGSESKWGDMAISDIQPQLLEKHFDSCITTDDKNINNENLQLTFNYNNLIPLRSKIPSSDLSSTYCEMKAIECLLETNRLRYLITHPLIRSFLDLKWNRLAFIFYINFSLCTLSGLLNIFYILVYFLDNVESTVTMILCQILPIFMIISRETIQMISSPCSYFKRYHNYLEWTLIGLILFIVYGNCAVAWRGTVSAVAILLIAYELSLLIGSLPIKSFAMHYVILETVATNFFKSLFFYSTIIAAFALAFCCLFHKQTAETTAEKSTSNTTNDDDKKYNNFQSVGLSMLKSIVMANGELDTSNIEFNDNVLSYFVFVAFILLVTTVIGNLLSGLAVNDINEIRSQAQWTHLIRRCEVLSRYEEAFRKESNWLIWFPKLKQFIQPRICLYPDFRFKYQVKVFPNKRKPRNIRKLIGKWFRYMKRMFCFESHCKIGGDIIREALKRVNMNLNDDVENEMLRNQIVKIANSNDSIQQKIDSIEKTMKSIEKMLQLQNNALDIENRNYF